MNYEYLLSDKERSSRWKENKQRIQELQNELSSLLLRQEEDEFILGIHLRTEEQKEVYVNSKISNWE